LRKLTLIKKIKAYHDGTDFYVLKLVHPPKKLCDTRYLFGWNFQERLDMAQLSGG